MTELKKLIEAAKELANDAQIGGDCLYLVDPKCVDALRAAIPAAEAELAGMGRVVEAAVALRKLAPWHGKPSEADEALCKAVDALLASLAPPTEPADAGGEE